MDSPSVALAPQTQPLPLGQSVPEPPSPDLTSNFQFGMELTKTKDFMLDFFERSDNYRQDFLQECDELWSNYLVTFEGSYAGGKRYIWNDSVLPRPSIRQRQGYGARLKDPETHQVIETLASQALDILFGPRDYLKAVPVGSDDPEKARLIGRIIMATLESPGVYRTLYQIFKDSFIFGTSVVEIGWDTATQAQVTKKPVLGPMGMPAGSQLTIDPQHIYKFGASVKQRSIYDIYPDPGGTRIQEDMDCVGIRFQLSFAKARQLASQGVYDPSAVERAIRIAGTRDSSNSKRGARHPEEEHRQRSVPKEVGVIDALEIWGAVPFKPADGAYNRVCTLLEEELVRTHINPYIDGCIPFKEVVVNPLSNRFYGLSVASVIRFLQDSADSLLMASNDAVQLAINMPLLMGGAFGGDPKRLRNRAPLDIIPCVNAEAVAPVPVDTSILGFAQTYYEGLKMKMREAGGATNPMQAIPTSDRQTATESSLLARFGTQRIETIVQIFERDVFPWIGRTIHSRNRQYAPPQFLTILNGDQTLVNLDMIDLEADVRFVGSLDAMSDLQRATNYEKGMNILSNPDLLMLYPQYIARYFRDVLKFEDAEQIVLQAIKNNQMKMIMEMAAQGAQANAQQEQAQAKASGRQGSPPKQKEEDMGSQAGQTERAGEAIS